MNSMRVIKRPSEVSSSTDVIARLHVLARDHREGRLSLEAYRKLRAPLLDSLDSGQTADSERVTDLSTQPRNPCEIPTLMHRDPRPTSGQHARSYRWLRAVAMAAAGGLLVVAALWMLACSAAGTGTAP
jgi:hypothetical protein